MTRVPSRFGGGEQPLIVEGAGPAVRSSERGWLSDPWGLVRIGLVVWRLVVLLYAAGLFVTAAVGDFGCAYGPGGSEFGNLVLVHVPPGFRCEFLDPVTGERYSTGGPGPISVALQAVLAAVPIAAWWAAGRGTQAEAAVRRRELLGDGVIIAVLAFAVALLAASLTSPGTVRATAFMMFASVVVVVGGIVLRRQIMRPIAEEVAT